jgi:hypothetical protein
VTLDKLHRVTPARRSRAAALVGLGLISAAGPAAGQEAGRLGAVLQGLDKTTARVSTIEAPLDQPARFGTLQIVARACHKKPPTETPESTAFLEIVDIRPDSPSVPVFTGWMFASSPAVSAMEHPVYDVWVIDCRAIAAPEDGAETEAPTGPAEAGEAASPDLGEPQAE